MECKFRLGINALHCIFLMELFIIKIHCTIIMSNCPFCDFEAEDGEVRSAEDRVSDHINGAHPNAECCGKCYEWSYECSVNDCGCEYCDNCDSNHWSCERDNCGRSDNCNSCDELCKSCDRPPGIEGIY